MTVALFIRRLLVLVILAFLLLTGMRRDMNGGSHSPPEADDPSGEPNHHLPPPWPTSAPAPICPAAGASGGDMGCRGDGIDQVTLWLFVWGCACTVASYLGRWLNLARIAFEVLVESKMRARARAGAGAGAARPRPPAPPVAADDNAAAEGAPANLAELAPISPVLADDNVEGGVGADLAARAPGAPPVLANDDAQGPPANLAAQALGAPSALADDDAEGAPTNLTASAPGAPTPPPAAAAVQGAGNVPGAAAGEAKIGAEVESSSISGFSSSAAPASTPVALPSLCPGRRPLRPVPRRSISLPDRLIPTPSAVTRISGDFASLARANTIADIFDGGNGRGQ